MNTVQDNPVAREIARRAAVKQARAERLASVGNDKEALTQVYVPVALPNGEYHYEWQECRRTEHPDAEIARAQKEGRYRPEQELSRSKPAMFATKGLKTTDRGLPWAGVTAAEDMEITKGVKADPLTRSQRRLVRRHNAVYKRNRKPIRNIEEGVGV